MDGNLVKSCIQRYTSGLTHIQRNTPGLTPIQRNASGLTPIQRNTSGLSPYSATRQDSLPYSATRPDSLPYSATRPDSLPYSATRQDSLTYSATRLVTIFFYTTKIYKVFCSPNISETVAGRLMKFARRPCIASTMIKLISKPIALPILLILVKTIQRIVADPNGKLYRRHLIRRTPFPVSVTLPRVLAKCCRYLLCFANIQSG